MEDKKDQEVYESKTHPHKTPCGNLYVTILREDDGEIWGLLGAGAKNGTCAACVVEAISRLTSLAIRSGRKKVTVNDVVKTLKGISCTSSDEDMSFSCPHAVALALEKDEESNREAKNETP